MLRAIEAEDLLDSVKTQLIESEKIGALGLDVVEGEEGITHVDHRIDIISNQNMAYLRQFRNVVMTQHMAFYTEEAVENMVRSTVKIQSIFSLFICQDRKSPCKHVLFILRQNTNDFSNMRWNNHGKYGRIKYPNKGSCKVHCLLLRAIEAGDLLDSVKIKKGCHE